MTALGTTYRQSEALAFLRTFRMRNGTYPTVEELATGLGLRSKSSAVRLLEGLVERGHIRRVGRLPRAIEIIDHNVPDVVFSNFPLPGRRASASECLLRSARREGLRRHNRRDRAAPRHDGRVAPQGGKRVMTDIIVAALILVGLLFARPAVEWAAHAASTIGFAVFFLVAVGIVAIVFTPMG